jgi:hypothetical protein
MQSSITTIDENIISEEIYSEGSGACAAYTKSPATPLIKPMLQPYHQPPEIKLPASCGLQEQIIGGTDTFNLDDDDNLDYQTTPFILDQSPSRNYSMHSACGNLPSIISTASEEQSAFKSDENHHQLMILDLDFSRPEQSDNHNNNHSSNSNNSPPQPIPRSVFSIKKHIENKLNKNKRITS